MIQIEHLGKTYESAAGNVEALRDINLTIEDGDIFGIIGLSGAGKSRGNAPVTPPRLRSFLHGNVQKAPEWSHHPGAFFLLFRVIFPDFRGNSPISQNRSKPVPAAAGQNWKTLSRPLR